MPHCKLETTRIDNYKFHLAYTDMPDFTMTLNFEPLATRFDLNRLYQNYVIQHFQGKPFGRRGFAYFEYDDGETRYCCIDADKIETDFFKIQLLQLPEDSPPYNNGLLPTAVNLFPWGKLVKKQCWRIERIQPYG